MKQQLEREKLSDKLAKIISDKIIYNELKSGDIITETQLSKEWGVSRSPVRDALHWLEQKRLIEKAPKGSYQVTELTLEYIENFYDSLNMFYGYSFSRSVKYLTDKDLAYILDVTNKIEESIKNNDYESYLDHIILFAEKILETARNPIIGQSARDLMPTTKRILYAAIQISSSHLTESYKFARLSYENLLNRRPEKANKSLVAFCTTSMDVLLKHFSQDK